MIKITWKIGDSVATTVEVENGTNLMEAARTNGIPQIEGECGGCLSCATCHVFVDEKWLAMTGESDEIESAMLEMTHVERRANSRLSCQITAAPGLDGLVLWVPEP